MATASSDDPKGQTTPIEKILEALSRQPDVNQPFLQKAKQQYHTLHATLVEHQRQNILKFQRKMNNETEFDISKLTDQERSRCQELLKIFEEGDKIPPEDYEAGKKELRILLHENFMDNIKMSDSQEPLNQRGTDPNTLRFTSLCDLFSNHELIKDLKIQTEEVQTAEKEFHALKLQWEGILDNREKEVRDYLGGKRGKMKPLSSLKKDQELLAPNLYRIMSNLSRSKITQKELFISEFVILVKVCSNFGPHSVPEYLPVTAAKQIHVAQGARPKTREKAVKISQLRQVLQESKDSDSKAFALQQYMSLRAKAEQLPRMREEQNFAQSVSMVSNPCDLPDDPQSSHYNIQIILKKIDPNMSKYPSAWEEYFFLVAEEQRFIKLQILKEDSMKIQVPCAQVPCDRVPQTKLEQESLIQMPYTRWNEILKELDDKSQQIEELTTRLSRFASQQLTDGNPNIADLSDKNRPTKIGESFGQLYDNEWSEAFDSLRKASEKRAVTLVSNIGDDTSACEKSENLSTDQNNEGKDKAPAGRIDEVDGSNCKVSLAATDADIVNDSSEINTKGDCKKDNQITENPAALTSEKKDNKNESNAVKVEDSSKGTQSRDKTEDDSDEEENFHTKELTILRKIVMSAYDFSRTLALTQSEMLENSMARAILLADDQTEHMCGEESIFKQYQNFSSKHAREFRKLVGTKTWKVVAKRFEETILPSIMEGIPLDSAIINFGNKCVELTWLMVIQDPPMKLCCTQEGQKFKTSEFAYHGRKGKVVELCVWPALYLHEGGPLVSKGHVLPKST